MAPPTRPTVPLPARASLGGSPPAPVNPRPALRDVTTEARPGRIDSFNDDDDLPHRRKIPQRPPQSTASNSSIFPSTRPSQDTLVQQLSPSRRASARSTPATESTSSYFTSSASSSATRVNTDSQAVQDALRLSPRQSISSVFDDPQDRVSALDIWSASLRMRGGRQGSSLVSSF